MTNDPSTPRSAPDEEEETPTPSSAKNPPGRTRRHSASWRGAVGSITAVAGLAVAFLAWQLPKSADDPSRPSNISQSGGSISAPAAPAAPSGAVNGKILFPRDLRGEGHADRIPQKITFNGTAHIAANHRLWLFVGFPDGGNWFPSDGDPALGAQDDRSITVENGNWKQLDVQFGDDKQIGKVFDVVLADVGPQGSALLADYFKKQDETGSYVGIPRGKLGSDIRPLDTIAVQRER